MKRFIVLALTVLLSTGLIGLAVVAARPAWWSAGTWFGAPTASGDEDAGLYCQEHGVPETFCTICHEELKDTLILCKEHGGLPEAICTKCHPEVATKYKLRLCKEHGLPESFCAQCGHGRSSSVAEPDDGWCGTHKKPEVLCEKCEQATGLTEEKPATGKVCRSPLPTVRLASAKLARQIGIQTAPAVEETHTHTLLANAETAYDANRYAEISPRVAGFLRDVRADLGRSVRQGEVLSVVDSAAVSAAKTQYLSARAGIDLAQATYDRTKSLARSGSIASKNELEALTALNQAMAGEMDAEQKLRNLGFDDEELQRIVRVKDTRNLIDVVAPIDGSVVLRHAVKGEAVQPASQLFAVADTSRMWLWIDVYESDIDKVRPGQRVSFRISGGDPEANEAATAGEVTWVGTEVNDKTRTTRVRGELANPDGRLRANQFGQAEIQIGVPHKAVVIPKAAVQLKDDVNVVFLPQEEEGVYRPQRVVTRPTARDDMLEVTWGLKPGQRVVTKGSFLLKTEIMKGAIGGGCCE